MGKGGEKKNAEPLCVGELAVYAEMKRHCRGFQISQSKINILFKPPSGKRPDEKGKPSRQRYGDEDGWRWCPAGAAPRFGPHR